jgi:hypothetical protein
VVRLVSFQIKEDMSVLNYPIMSYRRNKTVAYFNLRRLDVVNSFSLCSIINAWQDGLICIIISLTTWSKALYEKLIVAQIVEKFPAFMEPEDSLTVFSSARHRTIPESAESTPHTISLRLILISSHLSLGLPSGLFPSGFPTKMLQELVMLSGFVHAPLLSSSLIWSSQ